MVTANLTKNRLIGAKANHASKSGAWNELFLSFDFMGFDKNL